LLWNHTFSSTLINEARVKRLHAGIFNEVQSTQEPWGFPQTTITGLPGAMNQIVFCAPVRVFFTRTAYNIRDTARKVLNRHSFKFGVDIYKEQNTQTPVRRRAPSFNFNDMWDFRKTMLLSSGWNFSRDRIPTSLTSYIS